MLTILFLVLMFGVFGKLISVAIKMAWAITKVIFVLVFLPVVLIGLVISGLLYIAYPLLLIIVLIAIFAK